MLDEYDGIIRGAAERHRVPERFLGALFAVESRGNSRAISACGTIGLMQIMPATAGDLSYSENDPWKPEPNNRFSQEGPGGAKAKNLTFGRVIGIFRCQGSERWEWAGSGAAIRSDSGVA